MSLSTAQIDNLIDMIVITEDDNLDCDGCFEKITEFAEERLASRAVPDALKAVEVHLEQCVCCRDEFNALMKALNAMNV